MKLFVRNLPYSLTEEKLKEIFEKAGTVVSVKIVTDRYTGKSRGFGFVEMSTSEEGERAIQEVTGTELDGREIAVDKAKDSARR